ncbi:membrane protein insertion efficiency factor YidD [bacterium CG_4_10_14_0_2_um_filter_33_32]|nr:MAG: membrane protein insertion efficiency factor YidD [bacterium CG2_30_33_46]PIR68021.1 MAG: membrane protein insertion efficiency factor YidD [bacterium CG10_big_fil_rev_8_21_14_0_10_33_18]PIU76286.1 MAG: membrane protein insertion efficiency factor YidD [bacterium CG06_land_8_20_14_3_00_33_50]PIW81128.1 MAG: membrane protein insertion efficiency factor YidD [bacterium CG_4_8_14_3_um_filter_33_28]PIY85657.1 MAG: membrane protein insertion efficiency factor YidD [bacterium CG_4_10_14_0_8_u
MVKKLFVGVIKIYQRIISPDHSFFSRFFPNGYCRFVPSCSQYAIDAIDKYGALKGSVLGFYRINRCNPWSRGGFDKIDNATSKHFFYGLALILLYILTLSVLLLVFANLY